MAAAVSFSALTDSSAARAQDGGSDLLSTGPYALIFDGQSGPYNVEIYQSPEDPIVGSLRVVVEPADAETGQPVTDAVVRVFANPREEGERQYSPGLNSPATPNDYMAQLEIEHQGVWDLEFEITGDLGTTTTFVQTFVRARARSGSNTTVGTVLFVLLSAAFAGGGGWLWYSSKKARARKESLRARGLQPPQKSG